MGHPLISVIIPSYNHEKYVEKSILSVIEQPYKNVELIVIDDGSEDRTPEIIGAMAKKHGFYNELQRDNKGVCHTLNKALRLSKGRYIKLLASDDFMHDQSIASFVEEMERDPEIDACFGDLIEVDKDGNHLRCLKGGMQSRFLKRHPVDSVADISPDMAIQISPIIGPSFMIKKSVLDEFGPFDESRIVEDWDLFLFLVCHSKKISYFPAVAGFYRTFDPNDRPYQRSRKKQFLSDIQIVTKYKDFVRKKSFETGIREVVRNYPGTSIQAIDESPGGLLGFVKTFPFLWTLFVDLRFLGRLIDFHRDRILVKIHSRLHR